MDCGADGGFATALAKRTEFRLAHRAGWTVMAATLTELWSQQQLPQDAPTARG